MKPVERLLVCGVLLAVLLCAPAAAGLQDYVATPDAAYQWSKVGDYYWGSMRVVQLKMTSQVWQGIPWTHNVWVCIPSYVQYPHAALLVITGGSGEGEMDLASFLTDAIGAPVVILGGIPNQPLFDNLREDALIAYTFQQFLQSGDETWPLLFPMTKSAVRAMDAVQEFGASDLRFTIDTFVVTGASKRGWTTWLTGVVDPERVKGIAPLVIDTLNMPAQLPHQLETWGKYSEQIDDYTKTGLVDDLSGEGAPLVQMVDPYSYRDQITMPKLIVNGTNDRYWVIDALNLYYDGLVGEKYILYVPNSGHDMEDIYRVLSTMTGFFHYIAGGAPFPRMTWKHGGGNRSLTVTINASPAPYGARIWSARSRDLDFRDDAWVSTEMGRRGNAFVGATPVSMGQNVALFGEADFYLGWYPFTLSTQVRVVPHKVITATLPVSPAPTPTSSSRLQAGAAKVAITPWPGQYLAGYDSNRVMRGVHDDLWARALYLDDGDNRLVLVSLDSIGMMKSDLDEIADWLGWVTGGNVIISSTHTHSGPDVIGLWGPDESTPGWDESYIDWVKTCVVDAVYQASENSRPARVLYGSVMTTPADRIAWNVNEPAPDPSDPLGRDRGPQDYEITVLQVMERSPSRARTSRTIATAFNFACHPEVAGDSDDPTVRNYASSDIAHYAYGEIESVTGGMAMWLQGALGAMVTADKDAKSWAECERIGRALGRRVIQGVGSAHADASPRIAFATRTLDVPLYNERFYQAILGGIVRFDWANVTLNPSSPVFGLGVVTKVSVAQIGNLQIATTPGEPYPKIGLNIKRNLLTAPYKMVVGLGQDEVGYIMYPSDYGTSEYAYETSMSVGPTIGEDVERALRDAIGGLAP